MFKHWVLNRLDWIAVVELFQHRVVDVILKDCKQLRNQRNLVEFMAHIQKGEVLNQKG